MALLKIGDKFVLNCGVEVFVAEMTPGKPNRPVIEDSDGYRQTVWINALRSGQVAWKGKTAKRRTGAFTVEYMLEKCYEVHGGKFTYEDADFKRTKDKIKITCPKHGTFSQRTGEHLKGVGCSKCTADAQRLTQGEFIELAERLHGKDKYTYDNLVYKGQKLPVTITCKDHGDFTQKCAIFLYGKGCPKCASNNFADKATILYVINNEEFTKVGITSQGVRDRVSKVRVASNIPFDILKAYEFSDFHTARDAENLLLKYLRSRYKNPDIAFAGRTETFIDVNVVELLDYAENDALIYFAYDDNPVERSRNGSLFYGVPLANSQYSDLKPFPDFRKNSPNFSHLLSVKTPPPVYSCA